MTRPGSETPRLEAAPPVTPGWRAVIGSSVEGHPIEVVTFGTGPDTALVLAGMHGDEPKGVYVARRLVDLLSNAPEPVAGCRVTIVPVVNPDGYKRRNRRNAARVDLNRNFPTATWTAGKPRSRYYGGSSPASEPETRAVLRLVERLQPRRIVSLHSIGRHQFCNNYNGPGLEWARAMGAANGYRVTASIGYPTPGSFGAWAGAERGIPTITLELPSHHSRERCWRDNREALLTFIRGLRAGRG